MKSTDIFEQFIEWFGLELGCEYVVFIWNESRRRRDFHYKEWMRQQDNERLKQFGIFGLREGLFKE